MAWARTLSHGPSEASDCGHPCINRPRFDELHASALRSAWPVALRRGPNSRLRTGDPDRPSSWFNPRSRVERNSSVHVKSYPLGFFRHDRPRWELHGAVTSRQLYGQTPESIGYSTGYRCRLRSPHRDKDGPSVHNYSPAGVPGRSHLRYVPGLSVVSQLGGPHRESVRLRSWFRPSPPKNEFAGARVHDCVAVKHDSPTAFRPM